MFNVYKVYFNIFKDKNFRENLVVDNWLDSISSFYSQTF